MAKYWIGQRYKYKYKREGKDQEYLLAQVDYSKVALINLRNGNRWGNPVEIVLHEDISIKEWERICSGGEFEVKEEKRRDK